MKTAHLNRTSIDVTVLGFGTAPIGNLYQAIDDDTACAAVDAAWEGGVRYFDTAPHYGLGLAERRLGAALRGRQREEYVLSTKIGRLLVQNPSPTGSDLAISGFDVADELVRERDYSRDGVLRSLDASLTRLGVDRIDIVYVHDPEDYLDVAAHDAIPALAELRSQGVIGAVGAGMNLVDPLLHLVREADADLDVVMVAGRWTLLDRSAQPLLSECAVRQIAVVLAAPFNSGLLASDTPGADAHFDYGTASTYMVERAQALSAVCAAHGVALPHAALHFPLRHDAVSCVVAGMQTPGQAASNAAWATEELPQALWPALEAVCGHG